MKKLARLCSAFLLAVSCLSATAQQAPEQQMPQLHPLPVDTAVRVGTLPNGLTYYIRHNETPKGQADFYIAQKVGSILEEDNQRGLAHFLEHMCFNGTENFPGKGIINWLESIGVKFGQNLNAYTSIDETVYNISAVPVSRTSIQDSCLLILHDWANALTLDPAEIDAERGVIHEEWRRSMVGQMRLIEKLLPTIYPGNKYGERLPIGTMEVVDNFPPQALRDYYETWYRPDQQGIIVVGDIDPDYIEGKIKTMFADIEMPENARERTYLAVEDTPGTIYAIGSDPEQNMGMASIMFKFDDFLPRDMQNTVEAFTTDYMTEVIAKMLDNRLNELASKPDAAFAHASFNIDDFFVSKTKKAASLDVIAKGNDILPGIEAAYRELLRAVRGGFTQGEYERASAEIRAEYQKKYDLRNGTPNDDYSKKIVRHFVDNKPMPGIALEKQIVDATSMALPLEAINSLLPEIIKGDNRVVMILMPQGDFKQATEAETAAVLATVDAETIEPYRDTMRTDPLIPALAPAGTIKAEKHLADIDATEYTLSNGVKVIVKPTKFKESEIYFAASARGGLSAVPDDQAANIIFFDYAMQQHGLGDYSSSDLKKYLQGKNLEINIDLDKYSRTVKGNTTTSDLPTLMEILHATFTELSFSPDDFAAAQNMFKGMIANQESTPQFSFSKLIYSTLYKSPAAQMISTAAIDAADAAGTQKLGRDMLANAKDFTFYFVGDIDPATFKPLMEKYLANLPVTAPSIPFKQSAAVEPVLGRNTVEQTMPMQTPQTWVCYYIDGPVKYTAANRELASIASQIMSKRLLDKIREEMGATYSIGAYGSLNRMGDNTLSIQIPFPMKPEMKAQALEAINAIIADLAVNVTDAELAPVKEFLIKEARENLENNKEWAQTLAAINLNGVQTFTNAEATVSAITTDDVKNFWKSVLDGNNIQLILLDPAQ